MENKISGWITALTLEEMVAQLCAVEITSLVDEENRFLPGLAEAHLKHGIGEIAGAVYRLHISPDDAARLIREIQS